MANWDWAGLAVIVTIGVGGYSLGLPWWLIGLFGAAYAAMRIGIEGIRRSGRNSPERGAGTQD
jgi:hypothetical protein